MRRLAIGSGVCGLACAAYISTRPTWELSRQSIPLIHQLDPETAHNLAVRVAALPRPVRSWLGLVSADPSQEEDKMLRTNVLGLEFGNPVGLAAGFDKHAEAMEGMIDIGFGFVEIGSVTKEPQLGNPKPRVWRFVEEGAVANAYGFNSHGVEAVRPRLGAYSASSFPRKQGHPLGVNIGKNKETVDPVSDFVYGFRNLGRFADYLVVNVSSPNTPGLRNLQHYDSLSVLLSEVKVARDEVEKEVGNKKIPLFVKVAPDLTDDDKVGIVKVIKEVGIDGIIVSNTTIARPTPKFQELQDKGIIRGGLSGRPVKEASTKLIAEFFKLTSGQIPIIGVGGIETGKDAYEKIKAGASLVQLYSSMTLKGPHIVEEIKQELVSLLKKDGYEHVSQAVGTGVNKL